MQQRQGRKGPQQRQADQGTAVKYFGNGHTHKVCLHFGTRQVGEHRLHHRQGQEIGEQRRGQPPNAEAAVGHIVAGQVVIGAKIKRRAEPRGIVGHQPQGYQNNRQNKGDGFGYSLLAAQAFLPDILRPEDRQAEHGKQLHLGAASRHQRHAQAAKRHVQHDFAMVLHRGVGGAQPLPQGQQHKCRAAQDGVFIHRGAQQQVVHLATARNARRSQQAGRR